MSRTSFDVAIVGLGAMGAAAAHRLAARGRRVVAFDRHHPPHTLGSTHGESRIIREAYAEDPAYVPLVQRAYELWREIERDSGLTLLRESGGLMIGRPESGTVSGALLSAREHSLPHEVLDAAEAGRRFPAFALDAGEVAVFEPRAGVLSVEACLEAQLTLAARCGADLRLDTTVESWRVGGDGVEVTAHGEHIHAERLVLAAGPWLPGLLDGFTLPLTIERQVMAWFEPSHHAERFEAGRLPIYIWEHTPHRTIYGVPRSASGVKVAIHHEGEATTPAAVRREVKTSDIEAIRTLVRHRLPGLDGELRRSEVCIYTNTPDEHFVIGAHPRHPAVLLASPCSGHGFKFSPAIGELLADLATGETPRVAIDLFRPDRFGSE